MRTKKRMLGILMTASMLLGLAPATAYAEESYNIWVKGVQITSENANNVLGDKSVSYDADTQTLTLDDAKIRHKVADVNSCPAAIWCEGDLNIVLDGESKIDVDVQAEDYDGFGIYTEGNLAISGDSLDVTVKAADGIDYAAGIYAQSPANYEADGVVFCYDIADLPEVLKPYEDKQIFVSGGGTIYEQLLPQCETAYVTKIYEAYEADTFFPDLDSNPEWELAEKGEMQEENGVQFSFDIYRRK